MFNTAFGLLRPWLLACATLESVGASTEAPSLPLHAVIYKADLYGFLGPDHDAPYLQKVNMAATAEPRPKAYSVYPLLRAPRPFRVAFSQGAFWFPGGYAAPTHRIPAEKLSEFDITDKKAADRYRDRFTREDAPKNIEPFLFDTCLPVDAYGITRGARPIDEANRLHALDVAPSGKETSDILLLFGDKTMRRWRCAGEFDAVRKCWRVVQSKSEVEAFPSDFLEAFFTLVRGDDYYFVTQSGKLYIAPKAEPGKKREMEAVWDDAKRPIVAVIDDADAGKTYLFARDKRPDAKYDLYFEMKPVITKYQLFSPKELPDVQAEGRLRTVLQYASILPGRKKEKGREQR